MQSGYNSKQKGIYPPPIWKEVLPVTNVKKILLGQETGQQPPPIPAQPQITWSENKTIQERLNNLVSRHELTDQAYWTDPRPDLPDHDTWQGVLLNALDMDPGGYIALHVIRAQGARVQRQRDNNLKLLPGDIDAITWERLKSEYLEPCRDGIVTVLAFSRTAHPVLDPAQVAEAKGLFAEKKQDPERWQGVQGTTLEQTAF